MARRPMLGVAGTNIRLYADPTPCMHTARACGRAQSLQLCLTGSRPDAPIGRGQQRFSPIR